MLIALFLGAISPAPAEPLLQNALERHSLSLNGDWHAIVDSRDNGVARRYFQNLNPFTSSGVVESDFATTPALHVPGDWNSQRPELLLYEGTVWYERAFSYHLEAGRRAFFHVGGANYRARVWITGQPLCEHEGGLTAFDCETTKLLKEGDNFAVVSVNDARHADDIPALNFNWWNYGGLTRDVSLIDVLAAFIEDYSLQLERGSATRISGWVKINGTAGPQTVTVRIPDLRLVQTAMTDAEGMARLAFDAPGIERWSPERPRLDQVSIASGRDQVGDEIGFRTVEVRGTEILLNGRPIFLRGISLHEEAPYRSGRAHGDDDARALFGWVTALLPRHVAMDSEGFSLARAPTLRNPRRLQPQRPDLGHRGTEEGILGITAVLPGVGRAGRVCQAAVAGAIARSKTGAPVRLLPGQPTDRSSAAGSSDPTSSTRKSP